MIYRNSTGNLKICEIKEDIEKWRQKPETKEMIAKLVAEREAFIDRLLAEIKARKK